MFVNFVDKQLLKTYYYENYSVIDEMKFLKLSSTF